MRYNIDIAILLVTSIVLLAVGDPLIGFGIMGWAAYLIIKRKPRKEAE